jgi:hypothetical protein
VGRALLDGSPAVHDLTGETAEGEDESQDLADLREAGFGTVLFMPFKQPEGAGGVLALLAKEAKVGEEVVSALLPLLAPLASRLDRFGPTGRGRTP